MQLSQEECVGLLAHLSGRFPRLARATARILRNAGVAEGDEMVVSIGDFMWAVGRLRPKTNIVMWAQLLVELGASARPQGLLILQDNTVTRQALRTWLNTPLPAILKAGRSAVGGYRRRRLPAACVMFGAHVAGSPRSFVSSGLRDKIRGLWASLGVLWWVRITKTRVTLIQ